MPESNRLGKDLQRTDGVAHGLIRNRDVSEAPRFAVAITGLAPERQRPLVGIERAVEVSQVVLACGLIVQIDRRQLALTERRPYVRRQGIRLDALPVLRDLLPRGRQTTERLRLLPAI